MKRLARSWFLGIARAHPDYSDFTDLKNWNDTGVMILDTAPGLPSMPLAAENYLNDYRQPT